MRNATQEEINDLIQYSADLCLDSNVEEAKTVVENAYICVFEDYSTGGPGWAGKVMIVLWDGSPEEYEAYNWEDGKLVFIEQFEALAIGHKAFMQAREKRS